MNNIRENRGVILRKRSSKGNSKGHVPEVVEVWGDGVTVYMAQSRIKQAKYLIPRRYR